MFFKSDNTSPVHPQIMAHLAEANTGYALPYGEDTLTKEVTARLREIFEAPDAAIYFVATGTAANALALASYCQPWHTIFCSPMAHIQEDECNAPEFYSSGAKLTLVPGGDKMTPEALDRAITMTGTRGVHGAQRGAVSITQVTELGGVYSLDALRALTEVAQAHKVPVHLDGARFANAITALGCTAAEMTWKSGVDVVSFGGTKNGCMGVEAVVFFDPDKAWEFELRRKRGAHLFSKHRYLSAQMAGYLENDLWLELAAAANGNASYLAAGLKAAGITLAHPVEANMLFMTAPRACHQKLFEAGAKYYMWEGEIFGEDPEELLTARLVCDWSMSKETVDQFINNVCLV